MHECPGSIAHGIGYMDGVIEEDGGAESGCRGVPATALQLTRERESLGLTGCEDVCVCGHPKDSHAGGSCGKCVSPPCTAFWFRFSRATVNLARQAHLSDPVGEYWRHLAPLHSDAWVFSRMTPEDREEVMVPCWQEARFGKNGEVACVCGRPWRLASTARSGQKRLDYCVEEYLCEVIAAYLTVPPGSPVKGRGLSDQDDRELAEAYRIPVGNLRFRRLLEEVYPEYACGNGTE